MVNGPFPHSPLMIAREAQSMAKDAKGGDGQLYQKIALASMTVMAAVAVAHLAKDLLKEWNRKYDREDKDHGRGR